MNGPTLQVQMLGQFTLRYGDRTISDSDDRSRRVWSLLAYMLYNHGRSFAQEELIHLYWSNSEKSADPGNALKSIFHRIRTALDKLQPGLGRLLIRRKAGRYFWNNAMPLSLDIEDFEAHFHAAEAAGDDDVRLAEYQAALALYAGDPLPRITDEIWTIPIVAYYHSLYTRAAAGAIELLEKQERTAEAVALCRRAIHIEPYQEDLYEHLMRGLLRTGDMKGAMSVYEEMSELLLAHFGVMPSETLRTLYRQATRTVNDRTLTMDEVCSQLEEPAPHSGAMVCEYDFFKILYRAEARSIARNGHSANICLLSVSGKDGEMLARRSLDPAMNNLQVLVQNNLRRGDVIARCSISQYIILLPQANYENSRMVADRLVSAFYRRYPHSPARLRYTVQPLA
ncbi:bacterial transcriptional activator domain-containing protein [Agathobaculum butyriciproducens]|uniref:Bacterial transcriptional activator domain-containing protein n=1 Tax=Agathobaculum butyriciproducens TaxID=1628085 RepID=A0AAW4W2V4_9FIRM|nr:bacterial transcriptional activator domain-containing protein [Agathobaculum butyriciproducens]